MIDLYEISILKLKIIKEDIKTFYLKELIKIKSGVVNFVDRIF